MKASVSDFLSRASGAFASSPPWALSNASGVVGFNCKNILTVVKYRIRNNEKYIGWWCYKRLKRCISPPSAQPEKEDVLVGVALILNWVLDQKVSFWMPKKCALTVHLITFRCLFDLVFQKARTDGSSVICWLAQIKCRHCLLPVQFKVNVSSQLEHCRTTWV